MKKKKIRNINSYELGTGNTGVVRNYMQNPSDVLEENSINIAKAKYEGMTNPWAMGLNTTAGLISANAGGISNAMSRKPEDGTTPTQFAYGTGNAGINSEVEGDEVYETPQGEMGEFEGASHEQGGIDVDLPEGTKIFSKRLKVGGKTMAERKVNRENLINKVLSKLEKNPVDKILMNTRDRIVERNQLQEYADLKVQEIAEQADSMMNEAMNPKQTEPTKEYAYGSSGVGGEPEYDEFGNLIVKDPNTFDINSLAGPLNNNIYGGMKPGSNASSGPIIEDPSLLGLPTNPNYKEVNDFADITGDTTSGDSYKLDTSEDKPGTVLSRLGDTVSNANQFTTGDYLGMAGTAYGAIMPLINTQRNRATTNPNVNEFRDFGKDALEANSEAQSMLAGQKEKNIQDVNLRTATAIRRNRATARGVNTMRALDLTSDMQANEAIENIYSSFSGQMSNLLNTKSGLENTQDEAVMRGEAIKNENNKKDEDNYYSNLAENYANISNAMQAGAKNLNKNKANQDFLEILPATTQNGVGMNRDSKGWYLIDANGNKEYVTVQKKKQ